MDTGFRWNPGDLLGMPNTNPQTTTIEELEKKYNRAAEVSMANYAFYLGATNDNINEIRKLDPPSNCGIKVFMGSSTGNMLVIMSVKEH